MANRNGMKRDHDGELTIVRNLVADLSPEQDALLPLLHQVQSRLGYIPKDAIRLIAQALNLTRAEVHGVVTFYHDFHEEPTAEHVIQLCMAEACQSVGCRDLARHAADRLGVGMNEATADGVIQVESVYCFGNCAAGPTIRIDGRVHGRVTPDRFDALVAPLRTAGGAS